MSLSTKMEKIFMCLVRKNAKLNPVSDELLVLKKYPIINKKQYVSYDTAINCD